MDVDSIRVVVEPCDLLKDVDSIRVVVESCDLLNGECKLQKKTYTMITVSTTLGSFTSAARAAKAIQESGNRIPVLYLPTLVKHAKNYEYSSEF